MSLAIYFCLPHHDTWKSYFFLSLVYLKSFYQQQMLCSEKLVGTMNWEGYGRVLVKRLFFLSICPPGSSNVWEGKKSLCDVETDTLYVVSGYSFSAFTFYAQS